jgi:restriction endonuclease
MKLKFKTQAFQTAAVAAVVDLFRGQEKRQDTFTITHYLASKGEQSACPDKNISGIKTIREI